ncbi:MAG: hypothetical protein ACR2P4_05770 [Gammaproteobacteria bacterium]
MADVICGGCRAARLWRLIIGHYMLMPELTEALVFIILAKGGDDCGDSFAGMPPDWCQIICARGEAGRDYALTPSPTVAIA